MCLLLGLTVRRFYHSNPNQFNFLYRGVSGIPGVDMQQNTDGDTPSIIYIVTRPIQELSDSQFSPSRREKMLKNALHSICMNRKFKKKDAKQLQPRFTGGT